MTGIAWSESFDLYKTNPGDGGSGGILAGGWRCDYPYDSNIVAGRYAGQALQKPTVGGYEPWYRQLPIQRQNFSVGFDWINNSTNVRMFGLFLGGEGTPQITLTVTPSGQIQVWSGDFGSTLIGTTPAVLAANTWAFIEILVEMHPVNGSVALGWNGLPLASFTNVNTQPNNSGYFDTLLIPESGGVVTIDNMYVADDLLIRGSIRIDPYLPVADVSAGKFTSTAASLWQAIDENPNDGDTSFVESTTASDKFLVSYPSQTISGTILAVMAMAVVRTTGSGTAETSISNGTNTIVGSSITLPTGYGFEQTPFLTAPDTTAWTLTNFDTVQAGVGENTADVRVTQLALEVITQLPRLPPSLQVSEQSGYVAFHQPGLIVTEQSGYVAFHQPGLIVTEQSAYIAFLLPSDPPPSSPGRRRQFYLM